MTINIPTQEQQSDRVPMLHISTLKDLAPLDDHKVLGGVRRPCGSNSDGVSC
jgi:hypothetical protein